LSLSDELSIDRTILANERTALAYARMAITLVIAGVSIVHFAMEAWFSSIGILCIPAGVLTGIIGRTRCRRMDQVLRAIREKSSPPLDPSRIPGSREKAIAR
jgi:putative membrane protein